jgi:hypothetical protein
MRLLAKTYAILTDALKVLDGQVHSATHSAIHLMDVSIPLHAIMYLAFEDIPAVSH